MKRIIIGFIIILFFGGFISCVTAEFIKIGSSSYVPLPENSQVEVFLTSAPAQKYEEIGAIILRGGSQDERVNKAKIIAREKGGNGLVLTELLPNYKKEAEEDVDPNDVGLVETQEFLVIKLINENDANIKNENIDKKEGDDEQELVDKKVEEKEPVKGEYSKLPRATYLQLLKDYEMMRGELFKGSLYPVRYYRVPGKLRSYAGVKRKLLMVSTKSGKYKILLLVPRKKTNEIEKLIESKEVLKFVYSPLDVYKTKKGNKFPVLKYVDER